MLKTARTGRTTRHFFVDLFLMGCSLVLRFLAATAKFENFGYSSTKGSGRLKTKKRVSVTPAIEAD